MSKNFSYPGGKGAMPTVGGRALEGPVAGAMAIAMVAAIAAGFMGGQHAVAAQTGKADNASALAGDAKRGKELYIKDGCYQCHGTVGQGGSDGRRLAPDPLPWQAIAAYIRKPTGAMPPYTSKLVPNQDVVDMYAYLKTVSGPTDMNNVPTFSK